MADPPVNGAPVTARPGVEAAPATLNVPAPLNDPVVAETVPPETFVAVVAVVADVAEVAVVAFPERAPLKVVVARVLVDGLKVSPVAVSIPWLELELEATKVGKKLAFVEFVAVVATFVAFVAVVAVVAVVADPAVSPEAVPVILVPTRVVGVPRFGLVRVGEVEKTTFVEPVVPETVVPAIFATVVATAPAEVVTSPVSAGKLVAARVPVISDPETSTADELRIPPELR